MVNYYAELFISSLESPFLLLGAGTLLYFALLSYFPGGVRRFVTLSPIQDVALNVNIAQTYPNSLFSYSCYLVYTNLAVLLSRKETR